MALPSFLGRRRTYAAWLAFLVAAHVATYLTEPYTFGFTVLGLAWVSGVVVACGLVACVAASRAPVRRPFAGVAALSALIVAANVAAFAVLRTFRWA